MPKKVGIMTLYHKTYNYGAQLQAYALQKVVSNLGYDCELINFQWSGIKQIIFYETASRSVSRFREFSRAIPHSVRLYTPHDIHECTDDYDIFICGSDQIWGANLNMPIFVLPKITLSFVPDNKTKIAYAASMGGSVVTERIREAITPSVARLDAISVRESSAMLFVSKMTAREVVNTLDPSMLVVADEWRSDSIPPVNIGKYILVYNIGQNTFLDSAVKALTEKLGCEVVSLSYSDNDMAGPKEFLGLIDNAEFVLTNSFHGTVFSILFHKQFFSFSVDTSNTEFSKNVRIVDLLAAFNLNERFINDKAVDIEELLSKPIDFTKAEGLLNEKRDISINFLTHSLRLENKDKLGFSLLSKTIDEPAQQDYLTSIFEKCDSQKLFYENKLIEQYLEYEAEQAALYYDSKRITLVAKLQKFLYLGLSMNDNPAIKGKVIIYGAGQIGKITYDCFDRDVVCFIDRSDRETMCRGLPVYRLHCGDLVKIVAKSGAVTIIVTPSRDSEAICDEIHQIFDKANIVTAESLVEELWL